MNFRDFMDQMIEVAEGRLDAATARAPRKSVAKPDRVKPRGAGSRRNGVRIMTCGNGIEGRATLRNGYADASWF